VHELAPALGLLLSKTVGFGLTSLVLDLLLSKAVGLGLASLFLSLLLEATCCSWACRAALLLEAQLLFGLALLLSLLLLSGLLGPCQRVLRAAHETLDAAVAWIQGLSLLERPMAAW